MKKIRKIVALALATVMMMAMSITAFADEAVKTASITINGVEAGATANIYTVATVNDKNKIEKSTWASSYPVEESQTIEEAIVSEEMTAAQVQALNKNFTDKKPSAVKPAQVATDKTVTFTDLAAGVYYIDITPAEGSSTVYSPMVVVAITRDGNGNYEAVDKTATAKATTDDLEKEAKDKLVYNGQVVDFKITKTLPNHVTKFVVYDYTTNLSSLKDVKAKVTVEGQDAKEYTFVEAFNDKNKDNRFALDLTDLVYDGTDFVVANAGKKVTIEYSATVADPEYNEFKNEATYSTKDGEESTPKKTEGFEARITLEKTGLDKAILPGAEFTLTKNGTKLYFTGKNARGEYVYDTSVTSTTEGATDTLVTDDEGLIKVVGLDEGTYQFTETKAPTGYSINEDIDEVVITEDMDDYSVELPVVDPTLVKLPFTGGMGTTIFTVLGVAIMAMASALYFATKKKATK
ncbi:SpaA isopeptide-forming pilin-related protein [Pseudobutyrivibrio ruminis]|uniref:LPXTG-motif cell wall anchor domain-containing protein n=1 Tax=Pseudobutyrivibrio ruminis DSM 9787 TaxID=1123011 RepID=A0A285RQT9_9FIRM|nr:SpaA isopeptide-forming pilin-related protein [Pseudobutyrivibrio ruminis]SOB96410.1 LPXTG-motif cell wall anchor domain-containing protein [Pseudobutyrivibrio ruminis DSM 9787]